MKLKNKIKKVLPLAGLAVCAGIGATITATQINHSTAQTQAITQASSTDLIPDEQVYIDGWFSGAAKDLSTINGQEIVDAIKSFVAGNYNQTNQNNAYNFTFYKGETAAQALLKNVQENIKFI